MCENSPPKLGGVARRRFICRAGVVPTTKSTSYRGSAQEPLFLVSPYRAHIRSGHYFIVSPYRAHIRSAHYFIVSPYRAHIRSAHYFIVSPYRAHIRSAHYFIVSPYRAHIRSAHARLRPAKEASQLFFVGAATPPN